MTLSIKYYENLKKFINIMEHTCIAAQIVILIIVFLCSLSVVLSVFHSNFLDFMSPFFNFIKDLMTNMFGSNIKSTHPDIDGRMVLFVVFGIVLSFFISQLKMALHCYKNEAQVKLTKTKIKVEEDMNKQLKDDLNSDIASQNHFLMAIQVRIRSTVRNNSNGDMPTKEDMEAIKLEILTKFFEQVKLITGLKFSKDNDILLLDANNINNFDKINTRVTEIINEMKVEYAEKKIAIRTRLAVTVHKAGVSIVTAYKSIKPLLELNALNELLCFGNFRNRYEIIPDRSYKVAVKGKYDLNDGNEETIWSIVKKN